MFLLSLRDPTTGLREPFAALLLPMPIEGGAKSFAGESIGIDPVVPEQPKFLRRCSKRYQFLCHLHHLDGHSRQATFVLRAVDGTVGGRGPTFSW